MFCFPKAALLPQSALAVALLFAGLSFVDTPVHAQIQAQAQTQARPPAKPLEPPSVARADPADPKAAIPALALRSSLSRYQAFTEAEVAPWRETNDTVRQRGGWRAYAREAREPASATTPSPAAPAASRPAPSAKPAMPGHAGHEMK